MTEEIWKPVVGFEGLYEVSNLGRVRSLDRYVEQVHPKGMLVTRRYPGRLLRQHPDPDGYWTVGLCVDNKTRTKRVHQIVATAFLGPARGREVCHRDGSRTVNRVDNLRYGTTQDNADDRKIHGTHRCGEQISRAVLTEAAVRDIKRRPSALLRVLAEDHGVSLSAVSHVRAGRTWRHV